MLGTTLSLNFSSNNHKDSAFQKAHSYFPYGFNITILEVSKISGLLYIVPTTYLSQFLLFSIIFQYCIIRDD